MLVSRMVRALLEGAAPHEILAITFTKKAAGEMRERLYEWLRDFARQHPRWGHRRAYHDARAIGWSKEPIVEMLIPSTLDDS